MRILGRLPVVVAAVLAAAPAGAQVGSAADRPRHPIAVRVVAPADTLAARFVHDGTGTTLPNPATSVAVGAQARDAYATAVARLFGAEPVRASAELVVQVTSSEIELDREGWYAAVEHALALRDGAGATIARWRVRGEGRIVGLGEKAIPAAFRAAAEYAARTFVAELELGADEAARAWLAGAGGVPSPPGAVAAGAPVRLEPTSAPFVAPRSRALMFAEVGGAVLREGDALSGGLSVRSGWSGRTALLQLSLDFWERPFTANRADAWGSGEGMLRPLSVGVDGGVQKRLGSRLEVQAGAGAAAIVAWASARYTPISDPTSTATASASAYGLAVSVFTGLRLNAVLPRTGIRCRVGLEARRRFATRLDLPELGRELGVADFSAGVLVGLELPWGPVAGRDAPADVGGARRQ